MATDADTLSMAAYSAATARMTVQRGGLSKALHRVRTSHYTAVDSPAV